MFSQYRYALGVPGEGVHFHVHGIAIVDVLLTVAGAAIINVFVGKRVANSTLVSFVIILAMLFASAVFMHWLFDVPTTVTTWLGLVSKFIGGPGA